MAKRAYHRIPLNTEQRKAIEDWDDARRALPSAKELARTLGLAVTERYIENVVAQHRYRLRKRALSVQSR